MEKLKKITNLEAISQNYNLQLNGENGVQDHLSSSFMITRPLVKTKVGGRTIHHQQPSKN